MADIRTKDKTVLSSLGLDGFFGGGVGMVDGADVRIVHARPMRYGWTCKQEDVRQWEKKRNGKTIEPVGKFPPGPFLLAYEKAFYSSHLIQYPLKDVDWNSNGQRHVQKRGIGKHVRISWGAATPLGGQEFKRMHNHFSDRRHLRELGRTGRKRLSRPGGITNGQEEGSVEKSVA